ncbi:FT-interacting protein 7-like [Pistacia vera]|uniref:FT-interacting protein 7-like n=1 Tax=Pistacia vera TaxID=55513 RepID=UPI00126394A6|nr:FT-interacting protein 7-like [Pistacia vera]
MHFAKAAGPATSGMHMEIPKTNPESPLVENSPPIAARRRYRGGDKKLSTYDLVEQMHYLYVNVVRAKNLPVMDVSGSLNPFVEMKLGNYKGVTKDSEQNQKGVWKQIFAFSKERLQSNLLEVTVKIKNSGEDELIVGRVLFDLSEVAIRVPPDRPLAPKWYKLEDNKRVKTKGEIRLAVWMGTQADESFPEAWHSDAHSTGQSNLSTTRSKVYFSPKLYYLRVNVLEAQDLVASDKGRTPDASVRIQLGNQVRVTRPKRTRNPIWKEELIYVASEPLEDLIIVSVEDGVGAGKDEILGMAHIQVSDVPSRHETSKLPDPRWLDLQKPALAEEGGETKKEKFSSKILVGFCLEQGYHVLDESTSMSSDFQQSSNHLRKSNIGILDLGILSARNLLPMKSKDDGTTDAYCVAKYGNKWVRTRTLLDTLTPRWNEQYTWEVYDPCTVIKVGVFDNSHIDGSKDDAKDQRIGRVRIRLSTLKTDRIYTHYYPLLVLTPSGLKKLGELQLALRFTCTAWVNMVTQYGKPLFPKMHYVQPIPVKYIDWLRHHAQQIVAARLGGSGAPLRCETVEYMLDVDSHMWSLRRGKVSFFRLMSFLSGVTACCKLINDISTWRNPVTTIIAPGHPPQMDAPLSLADAAHPDELDEELYTDPTSIPEEILRMRYDRLRSVAGRFQAVIEDLASLGERAQAILSWNDPRATAIFTIFTLIWAVFIYVTPLQVVAVLVGLYFLRHPWFRGKIPDVPANFFKRLPSESDGLP